MYILSYPRYGNPVVKFGGLKFWFNPKQVAVIAEPVSVCHQWFKTGTLNIFSIQFFVSKSQCSPAMKIVRNDFVEYLRPNLISGSTRRITRKAVGTENIAETLCCSMILNTFLQCLVTSNGNYHIFIVSPEILSRVWRSIRFTFVHYNRCTK